MTFFTDLRRSMKQASDYRATVRALKTLDKSVARDLDIGPDDIRRVAYKAVYG